jgi:hypothetical protein
VGAEEGYSTPGAQTLLVDSRGNLWVATDGANFGLSSNAIRVHTILTLPRDAKRFAGTAQPVGMVCKMAEAPDSRVWMAHTRQGVITSIRSGFGQPAEVAVGPGPMWLLFDNDRSI